MSIIVKQIINKKQNLFRKNSLIQVFKIGEGDKEGVNSSKSLRNEQNPKKIKIEEDTSETEFSSNSYIGTSITFVETEGEDMD